MRIGEVVRASVVFCVLAGVFLALSGYLCFRRQDGRSLVDRSFVKIRDLMQREPSEVDRLYAEAYEHYQAKRWTEAAAAASKLIDLPHVQKDVRLKAHLIRARCRLTFEPPDRAIADCSTAIRIEPSSWHAYIYRASIYAYIHKYDKALADYSQAISLRPDMADQYLKRSEVLHEIGQHVEAYDDRHQYAILRRKQEVRITHTAEEFTGEDLSLQPLKDFSAKQATNESEQSKVDAAELSDLDAEEISLRPQLKW